MKRTRRSKAATIAVATLAISLLIGAGISEAMRLTSGNRAGGMRATAIRAQSFGGKSNHMSINKARVKRARVVGVQSVARARGHTLQGPVLLGARAVRGNSFQVLPIHFPERTFPERTIQPPFERMREPFDIPGRVDVEHVPERDMLDPGKRGMPGPDREYDYDRDGRYLDYLVRNSMSDISHASCLWDAGFIHKMSGDWGGPGNPLLDNDTDGGNWRCDPDDDKGGKDNGSGGNDTSGSGSGTNETKKTTETKETKEAKAVKETTVKPDGKKDGPEGDDPDEFRSPVSMVTSSGVSEAINIDMVSGDNPSDRLPGGSKSATRRTYYRGFTHAQEDPRMGVDPHDRPDATGSPVSSRGMANPMSYAASPTPDGGTNPPPGPEYNPVASATSEAAGSTMTNPMGYAASPAVGTDGKDPGPSPGPEF